MSHVPFPYRPHNPSFSTKYAVVNNLTTEETPAQRVRRMAEKKKSYDAMNRRNGSFCEQLYQHCRDFFALD
jgi:hypothetical protein